MTCETADVQPEKIMYKVEKGQYEATSDFYISHYHRIYTEKGAIRAGDLDLPLATDEELGGEEFTIFNLSLGNSKEEYFVVNGGSKVESWRCHVLQ